MMWMNYTQIPPQMPIATRPNDLSLAPGPTAQPISFRDMQQNRAQAIGSSLSDLLAPFQRDDLNMAMTIGFGMVYDDAGALVSVSMASLPKAGAFAYQMPQSGWGFGESSWTQPAGFNGWGLAESWTQPAGLNGWGWGQPLSPNSLNSWAWGQSLDSYPFEQAPDLYRWRPA